jgi:hypothetical protein
VQARDRVVVVVLPRQQAGQLDAVELGLQGGQLAGELLLELRVDLQLEELVGGDEVTDLTGEPRVALDVDVEPGELGGQPLAVGRIVPDSGLGELLGERRRPDLLGGDVKGTPWRTRPCDGRPRCVRCARSWLVAHGTGRTRPLSRADR